MTARHHSSAPQEFANDAKWFAFTALVLKTVLIGASLIFLGFPALSRRGLPQVCHSEKGPETA